MAKKKPRQQSPAPPPGRSVRKDKVGNPTGPVREPVLRGLPKCDRILAGLDERYPYVQPPAGSAKRRRR